MLTPRRFHHESLELNVAEGAPSGLPLVMLHGVTRRWQTFRPLLPALENGWHVHALDFRGHGLSDRAGGAYRVVDYVADAVALVESLPQPAFVYGHSLGAMVAAAVAAATPDHVRGVVLEDPPMQTMGGRITETPLHGFFTALQTHAGSERDAMSIAAELAEVVFARATKWYGNQIGRRPRRGNAAVHGELSQATRSRCARADCGKPLAGRLRHQYDPDGSEVSDAALAGRRDGWRYVDRRRRRRNRNAGRRCIADQAAWCRARRTLGRDATSTERGAELLGVDLNDGVACCSRARSTPN